MVCEFSQKYSSSRKKCKDKLKYELEKKAKVILNKIDSEKNISSELQKEYLETNAELEKIYVKECKGIRSRVRWGKKYY